MCPTRRWQPSKEAELGVELGVAEIGADEVKVADEVRAKVVEERAPNIQIYLLESGMGALCTDAGVEGLISVRSLLLVLGRTFSRQNLQHQIIQINETVTSSVTQILIKISFKTQCILKTTRKYMR